MKKLLCMFLMLTMLLSLAACAVKEAEPVATSDARNTGDTTPAISRDDSSSSPAEEPANDAVTGTVTEPVTDAPLTTTAAAMTTYAATFSPEYEAAYDAAMDAAEAASKAMAEASKAAGGKKDEAAVATMVPPDVVIEPEKKPEVQVGSGMLTAGEWKDLDNISFWTNVLNNNDWYALMEKRDLFANKIVPVRIATQNGDPCFNVPVSLTDENGNVIYNAVTDVNGMAYLLYDLDNTKQNAGKILVGNGTYEITKEGTTEIISESAGIEVKQLDLLFMIDTTGSMGDELSYLQAELRDVIRRVAEKGEALNICLSVNFYRDNGDEYVVRSFEFTSDIDQAIEQLSQQSPNGGGDYAEAVHLALDDVVNNHQWRKDSVKLCFMVLDAPPHTDREIKGIDTRMQETVTEMAKQGIRLIPLASSGVDTETEFLLRSWSVMTGGTYTFLTNHSGIGNSHLEPTIGAYEVEKLNDLLTRVISEYCGL